MGEKVYEKAYVIYNKKMYQYVSIERNAAINMNCEVIYFGKISFVSNIVGASLFPEINHVEKVMNEILDGNYDVKLNIIDEIIEGKKILVDDIKNDLEIKEIIFTIK